MPEPDLSEKLCGLKPNLLVRHNHPIQPVKGAVEPLQ